MSVDQLTSFQEWADKNEAGNLPQVVLPSHYVTITECATQLFSLIAPTKQWFERGGVIMTVARKDDGRLALDILSPDAARSAFEKFASLYAWRSGENRAPVLKPTICSQDMAKALLKSQEAAATLPRVSGLLNCPVLYEVDGKLVMAQEGYDETTKLLITAGGEVPDIPLDDAVSQLSSLLDEFDFQSEGDKSRAVASIITPALKTGGFLKKRVPVDVAEADQSQSGKTYRQRIIAAIYNEKVSLVTSRTGGVGSVDESFNQALITGRPFIQLDNIRGKFDSAHTEAFMTADDSFPCRVPHQGEINILPDRFFIFLSSNGVDTTTDFANRSNIIRIRKKPAGFAYTRFEEGDLLDRVRHWQSYFLGCVFAVIREWHRLGQQRTEETRHDFREWVAVVDWIVQHIFKLAPVMDGHRQAQERVSNPQLIWLRKLALQINETGELSHALTATNLQRICETAGISIPGLRPEADENQANRVIGTIMAKLFGQNDALDVDSFTVTRIVKRMARDNPLAGGATDTRTYTVAKK
jgi:hypothetical protein